MTTTTIIIVVALYACGMPFATRVANTLGVDGVRKFWFVVLWPLVLGTIGILKIRGHL